MNNRKNSYRALLIDLDGTLLNLDIDRFIPVYLEALSKKFTGYINQEDFISHLFRATSRMVENDDPLMKNEAVFYDEFYRLTGLERNQVKSIADDFYRQEFSALSFFGKKHPYSRAVIEAAKSKNLVLTLATNPVFPAAATMHRLSWSGLSRQDFQLVTTMDNMHFCKPRKEYYLEIAEKINCPPEHCLMAGNDTLEDLNASEAGMGTFLVEDFIIQRGEEEPGCDYRGSLQDLVGFIEKLR